MAYSAPASRDDITTIELENVGPTIWDYSRTPQPSPALGQGNTRRGAPQVTVVDYLPGFLDLFATLESEPYAESCSSQATTVYRKLETAIILKQDNGENRKSGAMVEDNLYETILAFFFVTFDLCFSIGIAYWHYSQGKLIEAAVTLALILISAIVTHLTYAFARGIRKQSIWRTNKIFALLTLIPGTLPVLLSFADVVFGIKETRNRSYIRPWSNTAVVYLVESLVLALPQAVIQSVILLEDPDSLPQIKGLFVLFSLGIVTFGIALARVRFDSSKKGDRFGSGLDKLLRLCIVWGNKGLWVTTFAFLVVSSRLLTVPGPTWLVPVIYILSFLVVYEVPVLISNLPYCSPCCGKISWIFFLIPQFVSLFVLILWVNVDTNVYITNIGICALGAFSWFESLTIVGWLLDGCNDRDIDIMPLYPHFLGDIWCQICSKTSYNYSY